MLMQPAYIVSHRGGNNVLIMKETLWKNNLNCVKDVPMIHLNFITILIVVFDCKIGGLTLVLTFILMINCMVVTPSLLFSGYQGIFPSW